MATNGEKTNLSTTIQAESPLNALIRNIIGIGIILLSAAILILLIIYSCGIISDSGTKFSDIKELFGILLPLIGTWVGTILAYYFSKENFEAANKHVNTLVDKVLSPREKMQQLKVSEIMLKPDVFALKQVKDFDEFKKCKIRELIKEMEKNFNERIVILEEKTLKFIFLIYRTTLERFMYGYSITKEFTLNDKSTPDVDHLTIQNMFDSNYPLIKDIVELNNKNPFLPLTATVAEASQLMDKNAYCWDVFITLNGNKDEKVEGWITNTLIIEKLELFKKLNKD
jgi:hypothetical protein